MERLVWIEPHIYADHVNGWGERIIDYDHKEVLAVKILYEGGYMILYPEILFPRIKKKDFVLLWRTIMKSTKIDSYELDEIVNAFKSVLERHGDKKLKSFLEVIKQWGF